MSSANSAVVLELAEEFLGRYRQGQRPSLKEYIDRRPDLAAEIREVFPAMAMMENIAIADEDLASQPPPILSQLGDYRILREVGRGGMGVVYEAEQVSLGRHVALKVLPNKTLLDARHKRRFEREAKAAAKLHHTNIVPVFGVGEHDGLPYYVMQFIQGLGLHEVMDELKRLQTKGALTVSGELPVSRREVSAVARSLLTGQFDLATIDHADSDPPAPVRSDSGSSVVLPGQSDASAKSGKQSYWQSVAHIGVQVASALDYAHNQGILHPDIKPSNLLLDTRGTVWVTDFGLAKADDQENLTATGDILGTLRYMAPEAFEGKADRKSDIYALGLTLYELLAQRPAFGEKDRHKLIKQVTTTEPERLSRVNPAIPRDLVTIVQKAIDREPSHRYQTADELTADLRRFLDDEPIHARRLGAMERFGRWCRRNPLVASLSAAVVLVTVLGFAATFHQMREAQHNATQAAEHASRADDNARSADANARRADANADDAQNKSIEIQKQRDRIQAQFGELTKSQNADPAKGKTTQVASLKVVNLKPRGEPVELDVADASDDLAISFDGSLLASGRKARQDPTGLAKFEIVVWNISSHLQHARLDLSNRQDWAFCPDGKQIAVFEKKGKDSHSAILLDVKSGKEIDKISWAGEPSNKSGWAGEPSYLPKFSADGRFLSITMPNANVVQIWRLGNAQPRLTFKGHQETIETVAFSDGKLWTALRSGTVCRWDATAEDEPLAQLSPQDGPRNYRFQLNSDLTQLLRFEDNPAGSVKGTHRLIEVFDLKGNPSAYYQHRNRVRDCVFLPNTDEIASVGDIQEDAAGAKADLLIWNALDGKTRFNLTLNLKLPVVPKVVPKGANIGFGKPTNRVQLVPSRDGTKVALVFSAIDIGGPPTASSSSVVVCDTTTGKEVFAIDMAHPKTVLQPPLTFSPDGKWLTGLFGKEGVRVWNLETKEEWSRKVPGHIAGFATFAPFGGLLAVTWSVLDRPGSDYLLLHDVTGAKPDIEHPIGPAPRLMTFSPDGKWLALWGAKDGDSSVHLWDFSTLKERLAIHEKGATIAELAFTADSKRLATCSISVKAVKSSPSSDNQTQAVKLWDLASGHQLLTLPTAGISRLQFSADGCRLVGSRPGPSPGGVSRGLAPKLWDATPK